MVLCIMFSQERRCNINLAAIPNDLCSNTDLFYAETCKPDVNFSGIQSSTVVEKIEICKDVTPEHLKNYCIVNN